jgi:hypothetical protein
MNRRIVAAHFVLLPVPPTVTQPTSSLLNLGRGSAIRSLRNIGFKKRRQMQIA